MRCCYLLQLCVQKLRLFVDDQDQNLKYLGLLALATVLKINPKAVAAHKCVVVCLSRLSYALPGRWCFSALMTTMSPFASAPSIWYAPLCTCVSLTRGQLAGMVSKKNLSDIVRKLVSHLDVTGEGIC
jgi:AP-3 complex subunit delta-1